MRSPSLPGPTERRSLIPASTFSVGDLNVHIVNIYLPKLDKSGKPFPEKDYVWLRSELIGKFGGVTQYDQAPAVGYWKADAGTSVSQDEMIIYEVICDRLVKTYWNGLRKRLETAFDQELILIRAHPIKTL